MSESPSVQMTVSGESLRFEDNIKMYLSNRAVGLGVDLSDSG